MTREEAYSILHNGLVNASSEHDWCMAFEMAIKALGQEPCDDTVSRGVFEQVMWERDTAIEQLRELGYELGQKIEHCDDLLDKIRTEIEENIQECVDENKYLIATGLGNALNIIDKYRNGDKE